MKITTILTFLILISSQVFAQDYIINVDETWSSNQTWSTNVIVQSGATLTIEAGVEVGIHYIDMDGDGNGDISITVEDGGHLVLNGTMANPIVFQGTGTAPASGVYWEGIVLDANIDGNDTDVLSFVTIEDANNALVINRTVDVYGATLQNNINSLTVGADDVLLFAPTIDGAGLTVDGANADIQFLAMTNAPGAGLTLNGENAVVNWADIDGSGSTGLVVNGVSATINNTSVTNSMGSGLFNNAGTVVLNNSDFSSNGYHGILTSGGSLDADSVSASSNTVHGVVAAATGGVVEFTNSAVLNNTDVGFVITSATISADADTVAVGNDAGPEVSFNYNNLYGSDAVDGYQVESYASIDEVADFTANWWGQGTDIGSLVNVTNPGSVDYINWRIAAQGGYTGAGADLSPAKDLTITSPIASSFIIVGDTLTLEWDYVGDFPYVVFLEANDDNSQNVGGASAAPFNIYRVLPNTGSYTFPHSGTDDGAGAGDVLTLTLKSYDADSSSVSNAVVLGEAEPNGAVAINWPFVGGLEYYASGDTMHIRWAADQNYPYVAITYGFTDVDGTVIAGTVVDTTDNDGLYVWTLPLGENNILFGTVAVTIQDIGGALTADTGNFNLVPQPSSSTWDVTTTSNTMQIYFEDIDLLDDQATPVEILMEGGINGETIWIGAFYLNENGQVKCAGKTLLASFTNTDGAGQDAPFDITVYGDDPNTVGVIDGVPSGTNIRWRVWRKAWDAADLDLDSPVGDVDDRGMVAEENGTALPIPYAANTTLYYDGTVGTGGTPGQVVYYRGSAGDPIDFGISVAAGWQLISSIVIPHDTGLGWYSAAQDDAATVRDSLLSRVTTPATYTSGEQGWFSTDAAAASSLQDAFRILKNLGTAVHWNVDGDGSATLSTIIISTLTDWNPASGYYLNMMLEGAPVAHTYSADDSLRFYGQQITPEETPLAVDPGWQIIPYWRDTDTSIAVALNTIAQYLRIVKDDQGNVYWPAFSINDIGDMEVGEGYLLYMYQSDQLVYPANAYSSGSGGIILPGQDTDGGKNTVVADPTHYIVDFNSDNSLTIGIREEAISEFVEVGDELGVFSSEGVLVGSKVYEGGNVALNAWGLESISTEGKGLKAGEQYEIRVWKAKDNTEYVLSGLSFEEGNRFYAPMGIYIVNGVQGVENNSLPTEFSMSQNYPNPFNPTTTINFALPVDSRVEIVVYNILGEKVTDLINTELKAGYHKVNFNATQFASGIYFYRLQAGDFVSVKKMNLLK